MKQETYEKIAAWASEGMELMKKDNISFDDLQKMLKIAYRLQTAFDVFWEK